MSYSGSHGPGHSVPEMMIILWINCHGVMKNLVSFCTGSILIVNKGIGNLSYNVLCVYRGEINVYWLYKLNLKSRPIIIILRHNTDTYVSVLWFVLWRNLQPYKPGTLG